MSMQMIFLLLIVILFTAPCFAESTDSQISGKLDFMNHCADCHGADGKGIGPMAKQLAVQPKNLTLLSKEYGGSFPETMVYNIIDGRRTTDIHGQEMPIWGERFRNIEDNEQAIEKRINEIIIYLESIQIQ